MKSITDRRVQVQYAADGIWPQNSTLGIRPSAFPWPPPSAANSNCRPTNTVTIASSASDPNPANNSATVTTTALDTPPVINCLGNIVVSTDPGQCSRSNVTYATPTVSDNCPGVTVGCVPSSGSTFPVGITTVTCTATDASGNTDACSFQVSVTDAEAPTLTCPLGITTNVPLPETSAVVNFATPTPTDNCPGSLANCVPAPGSTFPLGPTTVTCTATDAANNSNSCQFAIIVIQNPCTYAIDPTSANFPVAGGSGSVNVIAPAGCDWTAVPNDGFITVTSGGSGSGDGTVNYAVDANVSTGRTGTVSIAELTFTVTQTGVGVPPQADLSVSKTGTPEPVLVGGNLTYLVTVSNAGPDTATSIVVTDELPDTMTLVSVESATLSCETNGVITCELASLSLDSVATITINVTPTQQGSITNLISVTADELDDNAANNTAEQVSTVVLLGDLNGDNSVDRTDLGLILEQIRARASDLTYDLNSDGKLDIADARTLVLHFTNPGGTP